ncbi:MAG TPA: efflux RND transporter periplasmic adaptor subunit [Steroidobacteraceae bacterium]|jgi:cobalt-zinc-cadmium efflux system membrane fusion protein|nr:efflux RND transporter periplasmic adaptor subunit [Steroidobacteraceae bacterium]
MSESQGDPGRLPKGQDSIDRRAWSRERQWQTTGIAAAVAAVVVLTVWLGGRVFGPHQAPAEAAPSPPGTFRASAQQLKTLVLETVQTHGFVSEELTEGKIAVNGDRATPVFSPYSGRVTRVIAGLGDTVRAGAPLATLEASEFVQAQTDLKSAAAQVKLARINETRKHALFDAKGGSLQDWQQAQADLTTAETALNSVHNRLRILGKSDSEIADLERAQSINPVAVLTAPIAGVVVDRQVGPGQYLQSGSGTPVFTIANPSSVWLLANVREADAGLMKLGQSMEVRVLAYPKRTFKARVTYVAALVDPVTHRLPVRAEIDNHDGALKPEMFANFRILTGDAAQSPAVPAAAVVYEGDAAHVWVAKGEGLLEFRAIRTGRSNDGLIEVLDGLQPGERIVTKGGLFIDQAAVPASS